MSEEPDKPQRRAVLILGGTTEASALARLLADHAETIAATLSLAGRTRKPQIGPIETRIGGFGGADGLAEWLRARNTAAVVDATHPFAARMSHNAAQACERAGVPLLALRRPPWPREAGDRWIEVDDMAAAAAALGPEPRCVFLTIGRQELPAFRAAPHHTYHARMIEPAGEAGEGLRLTQVLARGPFTVEAETGFLREAAIEVLVSKNAGGAATYAKIAAARALGLPVVMVRRPDAPEVPTVETAEEALAWLLSAGHAADATER